jgi:phosphoglycerol transferase MdoB-like AlkP superfamily enzyme
LYKHGSDLKGKKGKIAQQIDIMPTVLEYLNYDEEYIAFGKDLLNDSTDSFAVNTNGSTYHIYMDDHILTLIGMEPVGLFNYKTDRYLEENLLGQKAEITEQLERKLKAVIQSYNSRLLDNNLIVRKAE